MGEKYTNKMYSNKYSLEQPGTFKNPHTSNSWRQPVKQAHSCNQPDDEKEDENLYDVKAVTDSKLRWL